MKLTSARVVGTGLAVALFVSACSTGAHHASKDAPAAPTTTVVSDALTVRDLGKCPASYPQDSLPALNAAIKGLNRELVPIAALGVLVCAYAGFDQNRAGSGKLPPAVAVPFEQETNAMSRDTLPPPACPAPRASDPSYLLIFASDTQRVYVEDPAGCAGPTNGEFEAYRTERWDDEVVLFSAHS